MNLSEDQFSFSNLLNFLIFAIFKHNQVFVIYELHPLQKRSTSPFVIL